MLKKLGAFIHGCYREENKGFGHPKPPPGSKSEMERSEHNLLLLSRRSSNPMQDLPGFDRSYYCARCRDYFTLAWCSKASPSVAACELIPDSHPCLRGK